MFGIRSGQVLGLDWGCVGLQSLPVWAFESGWVQRFDMGGLGLAKLEPTCPSFTHAYICGLDLVSRSCIEELHQMGLSFDRNDERDG